MCEKSFLCLYLALIKLVLIYFFHKELSLQSSLHLSAARTLTIGLVLLPLKEMKCSVQAGAIALHPKGLPFLIYHVAACLLSTPLSADVHSSAVPLEIILRNLA